nr:CRTAC1 family protein [Flavisolibacter sp.]
MSCRQSDTLFEALPAAKTNIHFTNKLEKRKQLNIISYLYYYNGGGVSVGDVNNDGLTDIYFTANSKGNNKLYLNKGNFEFEDITEKAGVGGSADWCSGVTMADVNGDGYLDIYVSAVSNALGLKGFNQLFINNGATPGGDVRFTESAEKYGLAFSGLSTQAAFFDFDQDGDLDCYLLNHSQNQVSNIPDAINRKITGSISGDRFYRNDLNTPSGKFTDITVQAGIFQSNLGYGLGLAIADFNNDGWDDVYVGNDFFENDYYYVNNGNGTFSESGAKHFNHYSRFSMGNDAADYNNDGQLDIITTDMLPYDEKVLKTYGSDENPDVYKIKLQHNGFQHQYSKNCLQVNNGSGSSFSEQSLLAGVSATDWSWCPLFADFDNDGAKDLFITNGIVKRPMDLDYISFFYSNLGKRDVQDESALEKMPDGSSYPFVFKGDGQSRFQDVSALWGTKALKGYFNGAAYADFDNDGNIDIVINSIDAPATVLKNKAPKKNFISLAFQGIGMNTTGIGAKAYIFQKGKLQYQQLMLTRGFQSSSDTKLHFGLASENNIDSLLVVWPDQSFQLLKNIKGNQRLLLHQKNANGTFHYDSFFKKEKLHFTMLTDDKFIDWK